MIGHLVKVVGSLTTDTFTSHDKGYNDVFSARLETIYFALMYW